MKHLSILGTRTLTQTPIYRVWRSFDFFWYQCHILQTVLFFLASLNKSHTFSKDVAFLQIYNFIYSETATFWSANRNKMVLIWFTCWLLSPCVIHSRRQKQMSGVVANGRVFLLIVGLTLIWLHAGLQSWPCRLWLFASLALEKRRCSR